MGRADFEWLKRNCERQILWFDAMSWRWRMWLWWRLCRLPASASGSDSDSAPSAPFHFHLGRPAQCHCHSALPAFDSRFANMSKPLRQSCVLSVLRAPNPHSTTSSVFSECSSCAHFSFQFLQIFPLVRVFCVLDRFVMHVLFLKNGCRVTSIVFLSVCPSFSSSASCFRLFVTKIYALQFTQEQKRRKKSRSEAKMFAQRLDWVEVLFVGTAEVSKRIPILKKDFSLLTFRAVSFEGFTSLVPVFLGNHFLPATIYSSGC